MNMRAKKMSQVWVAAQQRSINGNRKSMKRIANQQFNKKESQGGNKDGK